MTYKDLRDALLLFGFEDRVTLSQIKERFRALAKEAHPDRGGTGPWRMEQLNAAYAVLLSYCEQYRISFTEEEFFLQNDEARLHYQFADDPLWGKK